MEYRIAEIDQVIQNAVQVMEDSKMQIFEIGEAARRELQTLTQELDRVLQETSETIDQVDRLEREYRLARHRLTEVSRDFVRFTEKDIKAAYEKATALQLDLMVYREKESYLRTRRNELQARTKNVELSIERAETIGSQMNVVLSYLSGDLTQVTRILESTQNRQLIGLKIILAQEEERKRIAREIHDGPAQSLANLVLRTEIAERMLGTQELEVIRSELIDLKTQIRLDLSEIRKIIFNLRPMALDDLGLVPTLRKFVQDFEERTKIRATFEAAGKERRMTSALEAAMFRLVQEAFNNVQKHAEATFVSLDIQFQEERIDLVIRDNGVGFEVGSVESKAKSFSKFGLIGMMERVDLLQGKIEIESGAGLGTAIAIQVPINAKLRKELGDYGEHDGESQD
ncbi:sensor histidine kinase [Cohnella lubricantis]|uniref:Signal transduction histidine-protein kinase/phosphatase DegS n=1 Tax=Cohnella lubricantis TaxID=2163172 RepID=A0A841TIP0_9BACL|nr:sensor histidine kinase [Cohnella lubricantis]MBB6678797.1 sensor histidine kinase [Cohnella lubricantis]MBP2117880.1 two-component system sensor histidine kinase DegS [Cohnella lubricantis]